jgi:hypothetical protein
VNPHASLLIYPLSEILSNWLRVDLIVLCDLAERLSGLFVMAHRVNFGRDALHNVILPRSWFITLIAPDSDLEKDTSTLLAFVETMIELMQRIDGQAQRYLMSGSDIGEQFIADGTRMTDLTRPLYIARM